MNPTLLKHLEDIESGVHAIGERLEDARSQATHQVEERERLQQEAWSKQREAATLKRLGEDNAALTEENARLHQIQRELRTRLNQLLRQLRSLQDENPP
jgi:predicted nuclease with TOPRIM domain